MSLPTQTMQTARIMGEEQSSPSMLSEQASLEQIAQTQAEIARDLDYVQYYLNQSHSLESVNVIMKDTRYQTLAQRYLDEQTVSTEGFRDTLLAIWSSALERYHKLREVTLAYLDKQGIHLKKVQQEWNKVYQTYRQLQRQGLLTEISNVEINKQWFKKAVEKGKLTYLNFDENGYLDLQKQAYKPLNVNMEKFIRQCYTLINEATRHNRTDYIRYALSGHFSELFVLFDRVQHPNKDGIETEYYQVAKYGLNSLLVPVIQRNEENGLLFLPKLQPRQFHLPFEYIDGVSPVPNCTLKQFDHISNVMEELIRVGKASSKNYQRYKQLLAAEDKNFTNIVMGIDDDKLKSIQVCQHVINMLNRMVNLELEYLRLVVRSGQDLVYFAKCLIDVMKAYGKEFEG